MRASVWYVALAGSAGYLALTLYLLLGLGQLCPERLVTTNSLQNLGLLLGFGAVFGFVWFASPANPLLKLLGELLAVALFLLEMLLVVSFGAGVYLFDGRTAPLGC